MSKSKTQRDLESFLASVLSLDIITGTLIIWGSKNLDHQFGPCTKVAVTK